MPLLDDRLTIWQVGFRWTGRNPDLPWPRIPMEIKDDFRLVVRAIDEAMTADLVLAALNMAIAQQRPRDVIHHSDQGSQYMSIAFGARCAPMGVRPSMGSTGDAYDNAMAESFFANLECELIDRRSFKTKTEARLALFTWIEGWYNPRRRHSALGRISPINFERSRLDTAFTQRSIPAHGLPTAPLAPGLRGAGDGARGQPRNRSLNRAWDPSPKPSTETWSVQARIWPNTWTDCPA